MIKKTMSKLKKDFAERMNYVADKLKIPPKGNNRQEMLGKLFDVSQESARKWLAGESIPKTEKCIEICIKAQVDINWFLTGRGIADYGDDPISKAILAMQNMDQQTQYQAVRLLNTLAEPPDIAGSKTNKE